MENITFILNNFWIILSAICFTVCVITTINGRKLYKKSKKLINNAAYWKQQWENANNVSKDLQKSLVEYESRIIEIKSEFFLKHERNMKERERDIVMTLQNKLLHSGCIVVEYRDAECGIAKLKILKP
jgi:hypothetical protein